MQELFRVETETQCAQLTDGLLALERAFRVPGSGFRVSENLDATDESQPGTPRPELGTLLESLMRAAHSIKGAARIVNLSPAVNLAHAMEDCFVAAQQGRLVLGADQVNALLSCVDLLTGISQQHEKSIGPWLEKNQPAIDDWIRNVRFFTASTAAGVQKNEPPAVAKRPAVENLRPLSPRRTRRLMPLKIPTAFSGSRRKV